MLEANCFILAKKECSMQDRVSHTHRLPSWWKPVSIIGAGGLLALFVWTLPNWGTFWSIVSQFSALWSVPENRLALIALIIKVFAPLPLMAMVGLIVWIAALMQPSQEDMAVRLLHVEEAHSLSPLPTTHMQWTNAQFPIAQTPGVASRRYDPVTPLPPTLSTLEPLAPVIPSSHTSPIAIPDTSSAIEQEEDTPFVPSASAPQSLPVSPFAQMGQGDTQPIISIRLLKEVDVSINLPNGSRIPVPTIASNAKKVQLLAYIAWRQGELIDREKILEHIFGWGLSDEDATEDKLAERFESHKKLVRKSIRKVVVEQVNAPAKRAVIDPDIDPFASTTGFWGLAEICHVEDLSVIDACAKTIALARKAGKLVNQVPEEVKEACEQIVATYRGDFLESLIKRYPDEFHSWQGRGSWVRKPFTLYRDAYLEAIWLLGNYYADKHAAEEEQSKALEYCGKAAQFYQSYALYACNSKYDSKVYFGIHGEYGERVGMSERAIRRCVVLLGTMGKTDQVNQVWSAYSTQMKNISDHKWKMRQETMDDIEAAQSQTNAYRFAAQMVQGPSGNTIEQNNSV
jgi:hypothetical protein